MAVAAENVHQVDRAGIRRAGMQRRRDDQYGERARKRHHRARWSRQCVFDGIRSGVERQPCSRAQIHSIDLMSTPRPPSPRIGRCRDRLTSPRLDKSGSRAKRNRRCGGSEVRLANRSRFRQSGFAQPVEIEIVHPFVAEARVARARERSPGMRARSSSISHSRLVDATKMPESRGGNPTGDIASGVIAIARLPQRMLSSKRRAKKCATVATVKVKVAVLLSSGFMRCAISNWAIALSLSPLTL